MQRWIRSYIAIALFLLVFTAAGLFAAYLRTEQVVERYTDTAVLHSKHLAASEIGNWLNRMAAVVEGLASFVEAAGDGQIALETYLERLHSDNPYFSGIFFGRAQGSFVVHPPWQPPAEYDHRQRDWYPLAAENEGVLFSDFYEDAGGHGRITSVVKAVRDSDGTLLGVAGADLPIHFMEQHVHYSLPEQDSIHFVIDARGTVLQLCGEWAHEEAWFPELLALLRSGNSPATEHNAVKVHLEHGQGLLAVHDVPVSNWQVVSYLPGNQITVAASYAWIVFGVLGAGILLSFGLLFVLQRRWFLQPLVQLERDIAAIDLEGDLGYRLEQQQAHSTGAVRLVFNQLLNRLQSTLESLQAEEEEIRATNEELEAANQQLAAAQAELEEQHRDLLIQQEQLQAAEEYSRSIVSLIPDLLVRYDRDGRYLDIVTAKDGQLLLPQEKVLGRQVSAILPNEAAAVLQSGIAAALQQQSLQQLEYELPAVNGSGRQFFEARLLPSGSEVYALIRDISPRRRAEKQQHEWQQLMHYIIQHDPNAIAVFDRDLHYIYVSQRYLRDYDVQQQRVIGSHHYTVFPDIPERWRQVHQRALQGEVLTGDDDRFERADGSVDYTRWECRPWYDSDGEIGGIITYTEVLTEQRRTEAALADSEAYRQSLLHLIPDIVIRVDQDGRHLDIMAGPNHKLFKPKEQLLGQLMRDVLPSEVAVILEEGIRQTLSTGAVQEVSYSFDSQAGPQRWFEARLLPVAEQEVMLLIRDGTEQHQTQVELSHVVDHDVLTQLRNRRAVEQKLKEWERETTQGAVVLVDVNGLKIVNDSLGHSVGDALLRRAAAVLKKACPQDAVLGRWGGDEFIALLPTGTMDHVERVSAAVLAEAAADDHGPVPLSMAVGTAVRQPKQRLNDVIKAAEDEMYRHKNRHSQSSRSALVRSLQRTLEAKSFETQQHCEHLETWAVRLAKRIALGESEQDEVALLAALHDLGKVGIAESILTKQGPLNDEEWRIMKTHPEIGHRIAMASPDLVQVAEGILSHHERWDGGGYPRGLQGNEIPISARIVSIADAFEAMTSDRPYRKSIGAAAALKEIRACAGGQFDPSLAEEFIQMVESESPEILSDNS